MPEWNGFRVPYRSWTGFSAYLLAGAMMSAVHAERLDALEPRNPKEPTPPSSWQTRMDYTRLAVSRAIVLPALADGEAAAGADVRQPGQPLRIGVGRQLPAPDREDLAATATWTALEGGGRVTALSVRSPGAGAVRVAVRANLPAGAVVRFFAPGDPGERYPVLKRTDFEAPRDGGTRSEDGIRTRWSPTVPGDTVGIEIELPASTHESEVSLHVVGVSHIFRAPSAAAGRILKNATACEPVEVACKTLPSCPTSAVAHLSFTDAEGYSYSCSGTAVNSSRANDDNLDAPYLMTAAHCIESQATADTLETRWNYEHETCEGSDDDPDHTTLSGGAVIVVRDPDSDSLLLRLKDALPNNVCLAGWNSDGGWANGTEVESLHHPDGKPKQFSGGSIGPRPTIVFEGVDMIEVTWTEGLTLGGSSGAGLFTTVDGDEALIGTLWGGPDCTAAEPFEYFGRFDRFFDNHAGEHLRHTDPPALDDHGDTIASATSLVVGSEATGEIDDGADADVFRITVLRRGTLTVYTTGSVDTVGRLKREDGSTIIVVDDDPASGDTNFRIEREVARGIYYVKVTGYGETDTGDYRLHVEFTAAESKVLVPFFPAASAWERDGRQGFVRVVNHADRAGDVRIVATDDAGSSPEAITLSLEPDETQAFNSQDLESGNADKGLSGGTGAGTGDWRLAFDSAALEIEVAAYVRTADGFLTGVHDTVAKDDLTGSYYVPVFNPASNVNQRSRLRIVNPDPEKAVDLTITALDDAGAEGQSAVEVQLAAGSARTLDPSQLENGGENLSGALGDGRGKWRLFIESDDEIHVVNLLDSVTGDLTNLSSPGADNFSE